MIKLLFLCLLCLSLSLEVVTLAQKYSAEEKDLVDRLERSLLESFGLDERPKVNKSQVFIHPYMYQLYHQRVRENLAESEETDIDANRRQTRAASRFTPHFTANTARSFTHTESPEDVLHLPHEMLFRFDTSSIPEREILVGAELKILHSAHPSVPLEPSYDQLHPAGSPSGRRKWSKSEFVYLHRLRVFDVLKPSRGSMDPIHRLLDTRVIDARTNGTASVDVSPAVKRWLRKPRSNHGLFVDITPLRGASSPFFLDPIHVRLRKPPGEDGTGGASSPSDWASQQPLLVVHTDDTRLKPREKRSVPLSAYKRSYCRRYNLRVDFRKVDWDSWIVAPPGYDAFFCQGECPYPLAKHMNATNHAVIQNIIHSRYPNRVPSACCVPIKHSAMSMLYLDRDKKIVLKTYQDMIVESCGCQ